jgi:membrane-associated phospholipid phosphatase
MFFLATTLWEKLLRLDRELFILINSKWANPLFDVIMPFLRTPTYWVPLYLFIIVFVLLNYRLKGLWWIVFFLATVALTDMVGTNVFKYNFLRTRPCNNPDLFEQLRLLVRCPSGYGFTSNHAANHFGMATFIFFTFRHQFKKWTLLVFLWAGSICYAQIYVGVHYPADVVGGTLLGVVFGTITAYQFNRYFGISLPGKLNAG